MLFLHPPSFAFVIFTQASFLSESRKGLRDPPRRLHIRASGFLTKHLIPSLLVEAKAL